MGFVNAAKRSLQCNMVFSIFVCSEIKSDVNQFRSLKATSDTISLVLNGSKVPLQLRSKKKDTK